MQTRGLQSRGIPEGPTVVKRQTRAQPVARRFVFPTRQDNGFVIIDHPIELIAMRTRDKEASSRFLRQILVKDIAAVRAEMTEAMQR